eukprot:14248586-Alexandrium_andersonii.AAC.1
MSASLVGSEMCIRDRPILQPRSATTVAARTSAAAMPPPRVRVWPARPVSYTHLTLPTICSV